MKEKIEAIAEQTRNLFFLLRADEFEEDSSLPPFDQLPAVIQNEIVEYTYSIKSILFTQFDEDVIDFLADHCKDIITDQLNQDDIISIRSLAMFEDIQKCAYCTLMWLNSKLCLRLLSEYDESESESESNEDDDEDDNEDSQENQDPNIIHFVGGNSE